MSVQGSGLKKLNIRADLTLVPYGSSIKCARSDSPSPCTCTCAFSLQLYGYFFKENMTFFEFLPIKGPRTLQDKEATIQNYRKILNQNTKKRPGIEFTLLNYNGGNRNG